MNDIHCHILYGLDDGSVSIEESVEMARLARSGGTKKIIATPHSNVTGSYRNMWCPEFENMLKRLNGRLAEQGADIEIFPGQEIFCGESFIDFLLDGKLITLNGSKYPLVEFDFYEHSDSVYMKLRRIVSEGYVPVVAHPERYAFFCEDETAALKIKSMGCLLQVNKGSITGSFGRTAAKAADFLLRNSFADFVASDAHSPYMRTPFLGDAFEYVAENYSYDYAHLLFTDNPLSVIENREISYI